MSKKKGSSVGAMPTKRELRMAAKKLEMGASHILLKHSGSVNPVCKRNGQPITLSKEEARAEAEEVKSTLSTDNFSEIAGSRSDCSSFIRGGDLGRFAPGAMVPEFEEAVRALQVGELSGLVDTEAGIHIILRSA